MAIRLQVLGEPGRDNAVLMTVDTGQSLHRLLFDCGEGCLDAVSVSDRQEIEAVFFSHFHVDHVAGFDSLLRCNWCRPDQPLRVFGPPGAIEVIHHRLRGYTWNLVEGLPGEWLVTELGGPKPRAARFLTCEGFAQEHSTTDNASTSEAYEGRAFDVEALAMNHGTVCLAYTVREREKVNVDMQALQQLGLRPGPWLQDVKGDCGHETIEVGREHHVLATLRERLLVVSPGESAAYLTDFYLDSLEAEDRLVEFLGGCQVLVCENNYRDVDAALARKNFHMVSSDVGRLAARVAPRQLILFHLSDRYTRGEWAELLDEVRAWFPASGLPLEWAGTI